MENALLYILAFSAMAIALFACILPDSLPFSNITSTPTMADEATWIIQTDGTNYYAIPSNGTLYYTSTNLTYTINSCFQMASADVYLDFIGTHYVDGVVMDKGNQKLRGRFQSSTSSRATELKLRSGSDAHVIYVNATTNTDYYMIDSLTIYGNWSGGINKHGIANVGTVNHLEITNVQIYNCQYGYSLVGGQVLYLRNLYAQDCDRGIYFQAWTYRAVAYDICAYNCRTNIYLYNNREMQFYNTVAYSTSLYNGIVVASSNKISFYGGLVWLNKQHGISVQGSHDIRFYGLDIYNNGQETNNTYSGIIFTDYSGAHSTYNTVYGGMIYSDVAKLQKYAVTEYDANDNYNLIDGIRVYGSGTANIFLQGANSAQVNVR